MLIAMYTISLLEMEYVSETVNLFLFFIGMILKRISTLASIGKSVLFNCSIVSILTKGSMKDALEKVSHQSL